MFIDSEDKLCQYYDIASVFVFDQWATVSYINHLVSLGVWQPGRDLCDQGQLNSLFASVMV